MKHSYIAPINYLNCIPEKADFHLTLAHLFKDKIYSSFYNEKKRRGDFIIVDNSAFEYKEALSKEFLLSVFEKLPFVPDVIVLPDYPFCDFRKTVDSAVESASFFRKHYSSDVSFMAVPQSEKGDFSGWIEGYRELCKIENISFIGLSILGIPNAFCSLTGTDDISFNRMYALSYLQNKGIVDLDKKHHCLGLGSNIRELSFMSLFPFVFSNDSSSAIWHGINNIKYDNSVTGLLSGKTKRGVDFFCDYSPSTIEAIQHNIQFIENIITNN